ncbi:hypothetical protein EYF80_027076 [Liparis tanakae]|uniref:Uncharacterized protein n=1 Tax=Liparis tanakae TaxID=230148 RepID=A0A4Z2HCW8_9TELE|nr:hypothetical protein EYF80_027076 [Liparis tanakae]
MTPATVRITSRLAITILFTRRDSGSGLPWFPSLAGGSSRCGSPLDTFASSAMALVERYPIGEESLSVGRKRTRKADPHCRRATGRGVQQQQQQQHELRLRVAVQAPEEAGLVGPAGGGPARGQTDSLTSSFFCPSGPFVLFMGDVSDQHPDHAARETVTG